MVNKMPNDSPISLQQALKENHCPICFILERTEFEFTCRLQSNEEASLEGRLKRGERVWLCNYHLWQFYRIAKISTVANLVQACFAKTLRASSMGIEDFGSPCLACRILDEEEERLVIELMKDLHAAEFRSLYSKSDGLCIPHYKMVISQLRDESDKLFLLECQQHSFEKLLPSLKEVFAKRFWDTSVEARNAVPRGIEKLVGMKGMSPK